MGGLELPLVLYNRTDNNVMLIRIKSFIENNKFLCYKNSNLMEIKHLECLNLILNFERFFKKIHKYFTLETSFVPSDFVFLDTLFYDNKQRLFCKF